MKRAFLILLAAASVASAQTFITVTADTNRVIRTNFSLVRSQISDLSGAGFAISNITGLQTALDGKLATNGSAAGLSNFPASLLVTNGDASGLTNLPNADLGSATGILPLANGGTGATNASGARTALELGTAATNDATAFQPANTNLTALAGGDGSSLTNVTITDASTLTNFPAELLRTNGDGSGLTGVAFYPAFSNNAGKVLVVATNEAGVEWLPVSNTVTDASLLTNFPASLLTTNGDAAALTNFPTLNQNTTGTASNVTGVVEVANGGTGASNASSARVNLLPSYTGNENKVLALNSNATEIVWAVDGGGTIDLASTNATGVLPQNKGGTGISNTSILRQVLLANSNNNVVWASKNDFLKELEIYVDNGSTTNTSLQLGLGAQVDTLYSTNNRSVALGNIATITGNAPWSIAVGYLSQVDGSIGSVAIGPYSKVVDTNVVGNYSVALGYEAIVTNASYAVQLGDGTNSNSYTIQFHQAGSVNTNEWKALANSTTFGHYLMAAPTNGTNGQILALNSNATAVIWTNNAAGGGTADLANVTGVLAVANGGTGNTNAAGTNTTIVNANGGVRLGLNVTNTTAGAAIGSGASVSGSGIAGGVAIGKNAQTTDTGSALGDSATAGSGGAVGRASSSSSGGAVGFTAVTGQGGAVGANSTSTNGFAGGNFARALASTNVQLGIGTNSSNETIQFLSAGTIDTNEWSRLAALSTYPTTNISVVGTNNTNTLVFSNGILVEVQ